MKKFTLIELLVVIAIIGILAAILLPAISGSYKEAKKTKAKAVVNQIALACGAYFSEYGTNVTSATSEESFNITARYHLKGYEGSVLTNWRGKRFFESKGDIKNPWGLDYFVIFDNDFDGEVVVLSSNIAGSVAVWTYTDDGELIKSWEK